MRDILEQYGLQIEEYRIYELLSTYGFVYYYINSIKVIFFFILKRASVRIILKLSVEQPYRFLRSDKSIKFSS